MHDRRYLTVEEYNTYVKNIFDHEELLHNVPVVGEVSGCSVVGGHCYFTLKDKAAQISVICFDCKRTYIPKEGQQVLVTGRPDYYIKGGKLSISAYKIEPFGRGKLLEQLEELKQKLREEGLFDVERKKHVPVYPDNIAIITSLKGAALRDIMTTIRAKNKQQRITVIDVRVQGEYAAADIIKALNNADKMSFDVIVIARGGGSIEDLFIFNDEKLARAIFNAKTPIISAVGHETDYTICDFVADERAITPTAAGERIGYDILKLKDSIKTLQVQIREAMLRKLAYAAENVKNIASGINYKWKDLLNKQHYNLMVLCQSMRIKIEKKFNNNEFIIASHTQALESMNPSRLLNKGYLKVIKGNKAITKISDLDVDDIVEIYAWDGKASAKILNKEDGINGL